MKHLFILRHGKSDWSVGVSDFQRPLNSRGEKSSHLIGKELKDRNLVPDLIISSPAKRAASTAINVATECNYEQSKIFFDNEFYLGDEMTILSHLKQLSDEFQSVLVVGHNPTLENLITLLLSTKNQEIDMPTATIAMIKIDIASWSSIDFFLGQLVEIVKPKSLQKEE